MKLRNILLLSVCALALLLPYSRAVAGQGANKLYTGSGFLVQSTDFGDPCVMDPQAAPVLFHNVSDTSATVTVQIVNTGNAILFVEDQYPYSSIVIPPVGPNSRPRIIHASIPAPTQPADGTNVFQIRAQTPDCAWDAIVVPH